MRRIAAEAKHEPPYLDDLFELASSPTGPVGVLGDLTVSDVASRTYQQDKALKGLWDLFSGLTTTQSASCVGISKAVLLLTDGRIGPALDSQVPPGPGAPVPWLGIGIRSSVICCHLRLISPRHGQTEDTRRGDGRAAVLRCNAGLMDRDPVGIAAENPMTHGYDLPDVETTHGSFLRDAC